MSSIIKNLCICCVWVFPAMYRQHTRQLYSQQSLLRRGRFGNVYLSINNATTEQVAIKIVDCQRFRKQNKNKSLYNELCVLNKLSNPQIVKVIDSYEHQTILHTVLEYCRGEEELFFTIQRYGPMSEEFALPLLTSMLQTLQYLHIRNIVHRDIKLENLIYCAHTHTIKWIEFDLAKYAFQAKELEKLSTSVGTLLYCAPEILSSYVKYNGKCIDVWSLGVVFYMMLCGRYPFIACDTQQLRLEIHSGINVFSTCYRKLSTPIKTLLENMLCVDCKERYTVEQCIAQLTNI